MRNKEKLQFDPETGKLLDSVNNRYYLGLWGTYWYLNSYREVFMATLGYVNVREVIRNFSLVVSFAVIVLLFPVMPFLQAYTTHKGAVRKFEVSARQKAVWELYEYRDSKHRERIYTERYTR